MFFLITNNPAYSYLERLTIHQNSLKYLQFKFLLLFKMLTLSLVFIATIFPVYAEDRKEYVTLNLTAG
ncbi:MAG: hypothetical protein ACI9KN_002530 [Gammaproteobacteria bacterium]